MRLPLTWIHMISKLVSLHLKLTHFVIEFQFFTFWSTCGEFQYHVRIPQLCNNQWVDLGQTQKLEII